MNKSTFCNQNVRLNEGIRMNTKIFLTIFLVLATITSCTKSKKDKSSDLGLLGLLSQGTSASSSSATANVFSAAVPASFAVTSITEQQSTTSSSTRAPGDDFGAEDFKAKKKKMEDSLKATTPADCFKAIPKFFRQNQDQVDCYGPQIAFTSHSQINGTQMPGGDTGIWQATSGTNGEACSAAKVNSLISYISNKVDFALGTAAAMACIAKINNQALPSASGSKVTLTTLFTAGAGREKFTVTEAAISRLADSGGKPQFETVFKGSRENPLRGGQTFTTTMDILIRQLPASATDTTTYKGLIQIVTDDKAPNSSDTRKRAISVVYEKTATTLSYSVTAAIYPTTTTNAQMFSSTTGELNKASANAGGTWDRDYNSMVTQVDNDGFGKMAYGWQAGPGDGYLRTFNAETTTSNTGTAYFGFAENSGNLGSYNLKPGGMFCNWVGTSARSARFQTKLQKQTLTLTSGVWKPAVNNINYAPTDNCNHASAGAIYAGLQTTPNLTGNTTVTTNVAVTNDLVDSSSNTFTVPTAPSYP